MDEDLDQLDRAELVAAVKALRSAIRRHRDATLHDLCWYQPELWGLLPETVELGVKLPTREEFLQGCAAFRDALERELPAAEQVNVAYVTES